MSRERPLRPRDRSTGRQVHRRIFVNTSPNNTLVSAGSAPRHGCRVGAAGTDVAALLVESVSNDSAGESSVMVGTTGIQKKMRWPWAMAAALMILLGNNAWGHRSPTSEWSNTSTSATGSLQTGGPTITVTLAPSATNALYYNGTSTSTIDYRGGASGMFTPNLDDDTASISVSPDLVGCTLGNGVTCQRGTMTVAFSQPVANPVIHLTGLGANSSSASANFTTRLTLTGSSPSGASLGALSVGAGNLQITGGNTIGAINNNGQTNCASSGNNGAGCGSVRINGTVTSLTFSVALLINGGSGTASSARETFDLTVTVDEDFSDAPSVSFNNATAPSHVIGDLRLGSLIDVDNANVANATVSPFPIAAGNDNNGVNGDGLDEDAITAFPQLNASSTSYSLTVPISGASKSGMVCGWIDFNRDNAFVAGERACAGFSAGATSVVLTWNAANGNAPTGVTPGNNYVRLRAGYTSAQIQTADGKGRADSGEVEDYRITVPPRLRLQKSLPDGRAVAGDQFALSIGGTGAPAAVTTTGSGTTASGMVTHATATAGSEYTLSETGAAGAILSNYATTYSCTNARPGGGQEPSGSGTSFRVTPVAGDDLTCTFSNAWHARLTLIKTVTNDDGGTRLPTAWTLSASGPTPISGTTGSAAVTNAAVNPGTYTLSESALPAGYSASPYSCAINGGAPVSGNSVTLAAGDSAVCRIHNDDVGTPGQPMTCGITSHTGATLTAPLFGPEGVNTHILLENVAFDAGSTAGGSITRFVDSNGRTYSTPPGPGRWLLTNSTTTTRVTVTFVPSIPAHRIGIGIYDMGSWDATLPNNGEDASYAPRLTLDLLGVNNEATTSHFVAHRTGLNATQASYSPGSGVVTLDAGAFVPGNEGTWRQSVFLRGNANALVSALTLTATNIKPGDNIGFGLVAIPSCVTISKVTEGGVGSFDFTTTNVNNWNNTAAASPVTLTTTATGTPVNSARHYYAHPVASNGQGTQPVVLSETIPPTWALSSARCTDANSSRNGNTGSFGNLVGGTLTIPADRMRFESNITCAFTNTRAAILRLQKALPEGRAAASDQFTLSMTGTGAPAAVTTTGAGSTATGLLTHDMATPGSAYTLSEAAAGGADLSYYTTTYRCTNARAGGQTPAGDGTTFAVTPAVGDDLTCTLTNLRRTTDLSIRKTVADEPLVSGAQAVFTLVITNHGPGAADGATVRDPAAAGLDCLAAGLPAPTCSATGGADCPASLTPTGLQSGVAIPALPNGGIVTIGLTCRVTASGLP